jgi:hypothetical protein
MAASRPEPRIALPPRSGSGQKAPPGRAAGLEDRERRRRRMASPLGASETVGGRGWVRTSDLSRVRRALSR